MSRPPGPSPSVNSQPSRRLPQAAWIPAAQKKPAWPARSWQPRSNPVIPTYLLVNDRDQDMETYDHTGRFLWKIPCLARGQGADTDWSQTSTDTPPGLYKLGQLYADYEQSPSPPCSDTAMGYGWYSFDMEELEGQEVAVGRAGIMLHGGGSACGWPGAWAAQQPLHPTLGCVRLHNAELATRCCPSTARARCMWGCSRKKSDAGPGSRGMHLWGAIPGPRQPAALAGLLLQQRRY